ncbi:MAG TPA: hypothetical protein VF874_07420 [Mycobacterium sp.]
MAGHQSPLDSASVALVGDSEQTSNALCRKEINLAEIQHQRPVVAETPTCALGEVMDVGRVQLAGSDDHDGAAVRVRAQAHTVAGELGEK